MEQNGWRSRGYLPHFNAPDLVQILPIRLADALPRHVVARLEEEAAQLPEAERPAALRRLKERWLDAGHGVCWLRRPDIAHIVESTMLATDGESCLLLAWCIMPNHLHAAVELPEGIALGELMRLWKGPTARAANLVLGREGRFWFPEYHDRYVRDANHLANALRYIDENPVKAGLCRSPYEWPFGSARFAG